MQPVYSPLEPSQTVTPKKTKLAERYKSQGYPKSQINKEERQGKTTQTQA